MPTMELIFRVREEGSVEAIASRIEQALKRVGQGASEAAIRVDQLSRISQVAQDLGDITIHMGSSSWQGVGDDGRDRAVTDRHTTKGAAITPGIISGDADPQPIEEEKRLPLAAIEAGLAKQRTVIGTLAIADLDRVRTVGAAQAATDANHLATLDSARLKEDELAAAIEQRYRAALAQAGESIQTNIVSAFDEAAAKVEAIAQRLEAMSGKGGYDVLPMLASGVSDGSNATTAVGLDAGQAIPEAHEFRDGGIVPGPVGQAKRVTVHAGEGVFTPEQMRALGADAGPQDSGLLPSGDLVVNMSIDGRSIVGAVRIPLKDALRAGKVQVRAN